MCAVSIKCVYFSLFQHILILSSSISTPFINCIFICCFQLDIVQLKKPPLFSVFFLFIFLTLLPFFLMPFGTRLPLGPGSSHAPLYFEFQSLFPSSYTSVNYQAKPLYHFILQLDLNNVNSCGYKSFISE